jgi:flagellar biosynthesis protein FlhG
VGLRASEQSAGLRRLLSRDYVRSVTLVGGKGGIGRTAVLSAIAAALSRQGRSVLLLDQNLGRSSAIARLGLSRGRDLADVIERDARLEEIIQHGADGLRLVAAAQAFDLMGNQVPAQEDKLARAFERLTPRLDYLLVDAPAGEAIHSPSLSLASQEVVVMVSPQPESVTGAYALIRRLSWDLASRRFHIVANRVRSPEQGGILFDNIARAARSYLNLSLEYLGCVPDDDALRKASRLRQPVHRLFPESPAAVACGMLADAIDQWPFPGEDCLDGIVQRLLLPQRAAAFSG